jgi:hypothetical protein
MIDDKVARYRSEAARTRALAITTVDMEAREKLAEAAECYENLAKWAERHARPPSSDS